MGRRPLEGSDSMSVFYVTTPLYYVNARPHIGSAYTTIAADVLARYHRLLGDDVFFLTGTDEHGQKIEQEATKAGMRPKELADKVVEQFEETWKTLAITYDHFIRTTDGYHERAVQHLFKKLLDRGDIYKGVYRGPYCVPCESYHREDELLDGRLCPNCRREVTVLEQENYFFAMSRYEEALIRHFKQNQEFVLPPSRRNEVLSRIESGLDDISISRKGFFWGVPIPGDETQVIWVWFDALINYISGIGYPDDKMMHYWRSATHLLGKDILWFHACIWPAMLLAAELPPPKTLFVHGWWTIEGEKISKSKGNVIYPEDVVKDYGLDAFRYFMLREIPFGSDGDFSETAMARRINSDLADDLGNLIQRVLVMLKRFSGGRIPERKNASICENVISLGEETPRSVDEAMRVMAFQEALEVIWELIRELNRLVDYSRPWQLYRDGDTDMLSSVLYTLSEGIRIVSWLLQPFMPDTAAEIRRRFGTADETGKFPELLAWGRTEAGRKTEVGEILFKKRP